MFRLAYRIGENDFLILREYKGFGSIDEALAGRKPIHENLDTVCVIQFVERRDVWQGNRNVGGSFYRIVY